MRILFLAHRIPYPPNKGDKIRSFHILKRLAEQHEVHLGCLVDDERDLEFIQNLRGLVRQVKFDRLHPRRDRVKSLPGMLRGRPLSVSYFHSPRLQSAVDEILVSCGIDAIFCSSSPTAEYVFRSRAAAAVRSAVCLMDLIDVDSAKWLQYAQCRPWWQSWIYRYEGRSLAEYEIRIVRGFDHVLVVSEAERNLLVEKADAAARVAAVPNGVDLDFFSPAHRGRLQLPAPMLVFTGVMDYWPNVDGMRWFVERVFPLIRAAVPTVQLLIVGSRPSAEIRRLQAVAGVTVTGFVEDVRDYLAAASVCVVPLRIARGIQNKVLEAMAMGKPVVSTVAAFEGLKASAGRDLIVAADERAFADEVVGLLSDGPRAAELGRNARSCVERSYSWAANLALLDDVIRDRRCMNGAR